MISGRFKMMLFDVTRLPIQLLHNRFLYILKVLHLVPKSSVVHDRMDPKYESFSQVRSMMDHMVQRLSCYRMLPNTYVSTK